MCLIIMINKLKIMTISEKLDALKENYIKAMDKLNPQEDNEYVWWERENQCQEWSDKERCYVPMSYTKTFKIMKEWSNR